MPHVMLLVEAWEKLTWHEIKFKFSRAIWKKIAYQDPSLFWSPSIHFRALKMEFAISWVR